MVQPLSTKGGAYAPYNESGDVMEESQGVVSGS